MTRRTCRSWRARTRVMGWRAGSEGRTHRTRCLARLPTIEPTLMPIMAGAIILPSPAIIARHRIVAGLGRQRVARPERRGEVGEQRAVGVERLQCPLFGRRDLRLDRRHVELHHIGDVEAGDVGELGVLDPHARVDVGRRHGGGGAGQRTAAGGREQGELSRRVPVQGTLSGQRPGQIAEHRQPGERVDGVVRIVVVGHDVEPTAMSVVVVLGRRDALGSVHEKFAFWPAEVQGVVSSPQSAKPTVDGQRSHHSHRSVPNPSRTLPEPLPREDHHGHHTLRSRRRVPTTPADLRSPCSRRAFVGTGVIAGADGVPRRARGQSGRGRIGSAESRRCSPTRWLVGAQWPPERHAPRLRGDRAVGRGHGRRPGRLHRAAADPVGRSDQPRRSGVQVRRHEHSRRTGPAVRHGPRRHALLRVSRSRKGVLVVNHEAVDNDRALQRPTGLRRTRRTSSGPRHAHGVAVCEVELRGGTWSRVSSRTWPAASHANTPMQLTGPAAGSPVAADDGRSERHERARHVQQLRQRRHAVGHVPDVRGELQRVLRHGTTRLRPDAADGRATASPPPASTRGSGDDPRFDLAVEPERAEPLRMGGRDRPVQPELDAPRSAPRSAALKHENAVVRRGRRRPGRRSTPATTNASSTSTSTCRRGRGEDDPPSGSARSTTARCSSPASTPTAPATGCRSTTGAVPGYADLADDPHRHPRRGDGRRCHPDGSPRVGRRAPEPGRRGLRHVHEQHGTDRPPTRANPRPANTFGHILRWQNASSDHGATTFSWSVFALAGSGARHR